MDSSEASEDWETNKDAEKRARYAPVLDFFNSLPENQGWTLLQLNFTVGVRASAGGTRGTRARPPRFDLQCRQD